MAANAVVAARPRRPRAAGIALALAGFSPFSDNITAVGVMDWTFDTCRALRLP
jgi:hypothetical protein